MKLFLKSKRRKWKKSKEFVLITLNSPQSSQLKISKEEKVIQLRSIPSAFILWEGQNKNDSIVYLNSLNIIRNALIIFFMIIMKKANILV